jgi:hypothetical protein
MLQAVKQWFYNYGRKRDRKEKFRYLKVWTKNSVAGFMKRSEIQDVCEKATKSKPGQSKYLAGYQKALAEVVSGLSEEEESEYRALAVEWTKKSPPQELQRK